MMKSAACIMKSDIPIYEGLIEMFPSPNMHVHTQLYLTLAICYMETSSQQSARIKFRPPAAFFLLARTQVHVLQTSHPEGTCAILCISRFNLQPDWLFVLQSERSVDLRVS
jgi:hypothetical protein